MKNAKFNIISMQNGDVIATSCEYVYGVCTVFGAGTDEALGYYYVNGQGVGAGGVMDSKYLKGLKGLEDGLYHINSNHEIISKCPYSDESELAAKAHKLQ